MIKDEYLHMTPAGRKALILSEIKQYLEQDVMPSEALSTQDIVGHLWPAELAVGEQITERKGMVNMVLRLALELEPKYCHKGPQGKRLFMGKPVRPWIWHYPISHTSKVFACPHCGKKVPI